MTICMIMSATSIFSTLARIPQKVSAKGLSDLQLLLAEEHWLTLLWHIG